MPTVEWTAVPPSKKSQRPRFFNQMKMLKSAPNKWALVLNLDNRFTATNAATTFRNNGFQAAVRKAPGGIYRVYARYVP